MKAYLDSSALAKRYVNENGSNDVYEILNKASHISSSILCIPEILSACNRTLREKKISSEQYTFIKNEFMQDLEELFIININESIIAKSVNCLEKGSIRSLDALHIASALEDKCDIFITGDIRQKKIAALMDLKVRMV